MKKKYSRPEVEFLDFILEDELMTQGDIIDGSTGYTDDDEFDF